MFDTLRFWAIVLAITGAILFLGWKEPLRYRFMSREEIEAERRASEPPAPTPEPRPVAVQAPVLAPQLPPPAPSSPNAWMWESGRRTMLDERPNNRGGRMGGSPRGGVGTSGPSR